ncbi:MULTISPECIES: DUF3131 domain-containing protein [Falsihalocynthiibacter]|uniref:DUF3131 domain-containing protein n=1 Tax=Falsihalocynthiibacter TaxID=2854182 RepID=UPI003003922C
MKISRRNLMLQLGIQLPAMVALPSISRAESPYKSFQLILTGITSTTPPDSLLALLEPFVSANIPVSCIVSPEIATGTLLPDSSLAGYLRRFIADYPAQIEIVLKAPTLSERPYYFQSRMATQARRALEDGLVTAQSDHQLTRSVLTVANFGTSGRYQPGGVRAAGFRTVLSLPESGIEPADSRWDQSVLHIFGGMHFGLNESFDSIKNALTASIQDDTRSLLALSLEGLTPENSGLAAQRMTKIASLISEFSLARQIVPTTPTDYHVRASPDPETVIGLRLDVTGKPDEPGGEAALELAEWLRAHNFHFTVAGEHAQSWQEDGGDVCPLAGQSSDESLGNCRMLGDESDQKNTPRVPPRIAMVPFPEIDLIAGVDHQASLHPPRLHFIDETNSSSQAASKIGILEDTVLVLDQKSYRNAAQRQRTIAIINRLKHHSGYWITDVATLADQILPADSLSSVYHQTQEIMHSEQLAFAQSEQLDRDLLLRDAKLAWRYFKRFTNAETGLISSTTYLVDDVNTFFDYATMWDIGSQLLGMVAAVKLDLMSLTELNSWAERIIEGLPAVTIQGLQLPGSFVHVAYEEEPTPSFNTCDTGRLLNAFHQLRTFSPALNDLIEQKVASWSLKETIHDGRMHDVSEPLTYDRFISHCTNYAARGYAAFGIAAQSPYAPLDGRTDADAVIELLFSASKIGSIGAEPLLLEGVELCFTPETQYLADMLFSAQLEDNQTTGTMRCVSESPIDMAPWFTYQGYSIDDFANPWRVQVISDDDQYTQPDFLRSIEVVSVKAAYLWAATHPHEYSHALVDYVRSRARIENFGFSPGIYMKNGLPMAGYSDLNTNGIILEAIAHILKKEV